MGKLRHFLILESNGGSEIVRTGSCFLPVVWRQGVQWNQAESNSPSTISRQREDRQELGFRVTSLYHRDDEHLTGLLPRMG